MKNTFLLIVSMIASIVTIPCEAGPAGFFTQQHKPWSFIQTVGGMTVDLKGNRLLVSCDV